MKSTNSSESKQIRGLNPVKRKNNQSFISKFTIMKKQILFLILALVALGFSTQLNAQLTPRPLECIDLDDPLNVVPGQPYTYEVDVPTPPGAKTFHWFVTQDVNMIAAGGIIATIENFGGTILASGSVNYNTPGATLPTVTLTFQSFTLAVDEYVFLGILVENTDATLGCTTNNFKVYRIQPMHAFSLDIANVNATGVIQPNYGQDNLTQCIADIVTATFDPLENAIDYDFGENTFYYAVAAANFSGNWQLRAQLAGLTLSQTVTITWGYTFATAGDNPIAAAGSSNGQFTSSTLVAAQNPTGAVGAAGETIYIKMVIDHGNTFEGDALSQYTFSVNGNLVQTVGPPIVLVPNGADVHHVGANCVQADFDDIALQSLQARPDINSVNPPPQGWLPIGN